MSKHERDVPIDGGHPDSIPRETLAALKESEARWRSLAENMPNIVMIVDRDGVLQYINRTVTGISRERIVGSCLYNHIDPEYHPMVRGVIDKAFKTGEQESYQLRGTGPDGTTSWYETFVGSIHRRGRVVAAILISADITARKEMEEALHESEEKWRSLAENMPNIVMIVDRDGVLQYINRTVAGLTPEDVVGRSMFDYINPEYRRTIREVLERVFETGEPASYQLQGTGPDGGKAWYETCVGPILRGNDVVAAAQISTDITARKEAGAALQQSEATFRSIVNNATDGILVADAECKRFALANATICEMLGYTEEELLELELSDIHPEEDLPRVADAFERQVSGAEPMACDIPVLCMDGSVFYADVNSAVITLGGRTCLMGIFRDVTDRRRIQDELKHSREELRHLYARLSDVREEERTMMAREIHDGLGQSLAVLSMQLELLRAKPPKRPEEVSRKLASMADLVERSVSEMRKICTALKPGVLDHLGLGPAVEWQAEEFEARTRVRCHLKADLENVTLDQNLATAVFRILQESLTNVARHSEADEVWINCGKKDRQIELVVSDDGKGITEDQLTDPKSLGIAGMRERALEWGGELDISGVPDEGTTVSMTIPIRRRTKNDD